MTDDFRLTRTGDAPLMFAGELIAEASGPEGNERLCDPGHQSPGRHCAPGEARERDHMTSKDSFFDEMLDRPAARIVATRLKKECRDLDGATYFYCEVADCGHHESRYTPQDLRFDGSTFWWEVRS